VLTPSAFCRPSAGRVPPPIRPAPAVLHRLKCWRWWWRHRGAARARRGAADRQGSPPAAAACDPRPLSAGLAASAAAVGRRWWGGTGVVALVLDAGSMRPGRRQRRTRHECGAVAHISDGAAVPLCAVEVVSGVAVSLSARSAPLTAGGTMVNTCLLAAGRGGGQWSIPANARGVSLNPRGTWQ